MRPIVAFLATALAFAGGQAALASPAGPARASRTAVVEIEHLKYRPHELVVGKGTTVTFANSSRIAHTATDPGVFDSGRLKPGHSFSVRFTQKGTFAYHCKIHKFMHGEIVVE